MKIKPMGDRIVVRADATENTTSSGIFLASKEKTTQTGTVIAVGPLATEFAEGDRIMFVKGTGKEIKLEDELTLTVLEIPEVIGKVNNTLEPIRDVIVCVDADFGDQTTSAGIIIKSNIDKSQGISSRWMRVYRTGPDCDFLNTDDWVLVEYGRWTEGFSADGHDEVYRVDPKGCMAVSDVKPETLYYNSDVVASEKKVRT